MGASASTRSVGSDIPSGDEMEESMSRIDDVEEEVAAGSSEEPMFQRALLMLGKEKSLRARSNEYRTSDFATIAKVKVNTHRAINHARARGLLQKAAKLQKYSHATQVDQQIKADKAKAQADSEAAEEEKNVLRLAFHLVASTRKYFTAAKGISKVSIFANHNNEFVVSATQPHSTKLLDPIHFHQGDLPLEAILECGDLEEAPILTEAGAALLTKGGRLTFQQNAEMEMELVLHGVKTRKAAEVLSPAQLTGIEETAFKSWESRSSFTSDDLLQDEDKRVFQTELFETVNDGVAEARKDTAEFAELHAAVDKSADDLHRMHVTDQPILDNIVAKDRKTAAEFDPNNYMRPLNKAQTRRGSVARRGSDERAGAAAAAAAAALGGGGAAPPAKAALATVPLKKRHPRSSGSGSSVGG